MQYTPNIQCIKYDNYRTGQSNATPTTHTRKPKTKYNPYNNTKCTKIQTRKHNTYNLIQNTLQYQVRYKPYNTTHTRNSMPFNTEKTIQKIKYKYNTKIHTIQNIIQHIQHKIQYRTNNTRHTIQSIRYDTYDKCRTIQHKPYKTKYSTVQNIQRKTKYVQHVQYKIQNKIQKAIQNTKHYATQSIQYDKYHTV